MNSDALRAQLAEAVASRDALAPVTSGDPALARLGGAALRQHHKSTDSRLRRYVEADTRVAELTARLARAETREQEAARPRLTVADVQGARAVRDQYGWHRVVRVSTKSVTVATPYSWTERIPLDKVLEVVS